MKRLVLPLLLIVAIAALAPTPALGAGKGIGLPASKVEALIALQHPRGLNRFVRSVSDPSSRRYRHYATVERLVARYGASKETQKRVLQWLRAHDLSGRVSATGTFVTTSIPRQQAARILPRAGDEASASAAGLGTGIPVALRGAATRITLLHRPPIVIENTERPASPATASAGKRPYSSVRHHSGTAAGCRAGSTGGAEAGPGFEPFTPNQYLTAYGHAALHARGLEGEGQTVALVEQGGGFRRSDIATFGKCFGIVPPPITAIKVGPQKQRAPEDETTLDLTMLSAGAPGLDRILVYQGPETLFTGMLQTAGTALGSRGHHPDVISMSLGVCEPEVGGNIAIRDAFDDIFAVAAGAGISVLVSAGDQGSSACKSFVLENEEEVLMPLLTVSLPSSSPYVTAVGGTNLVLDKRNRVKDEIVWNDQSRQANGGGGGSSLLSPHSPWWQPELAKYGPGRKVPDISALADIYPGYAMFCTAVPCEPEKDAIFGWGSIGGTSAAAPLSAAGIALANQYAAELGQPDLGFLNPLIYQLGAGGKTRATAFDDVVRGNNDISRLLPITGQSGLPLGCCSAKPGYDWASGWGSLKIPGFAKLAAAADD